MSICRHGDMISGTPKVTDPGSLAYRMISPSGHFGANQRKTVSQLRFRELALILLIQPFLISVLSPLR